MKEELDALHKNHTWDLVDLPQGNSVVGCKWVYKIKTCSDGTVDRYKARLVASGFTQEYGVDYEETFAPVARLSSVRALLAVAASRHWSLSQMDKKMPSLMAISVRKSICSHLLASLLLQTRSVVFVELSMV